MYKESRKMVLTNLSAGNKTDTDIESRLVDVVGEGEGGTTETIALKHIYYHM